jgi:superfamily II DNA helicase RecQ
MLEYPVREHQLTRPTLIKTSYNRSNLHYTVLPKSTVVTDLQIAVARCPVDGSFIVYCETTAMADEIAGYARTRPCV